MPLPPIPFVVSDPKTGLLSPGFSDYFNLVLLPLLNNIPSIKATPANLSNQSASLATKTLWTTVSKGLYRVSYYTRITTPDGVSSSLTVTVGWLENGQALTQAGAALTGDAVNTGQQATLYLLADNASNLTIATTYASNTPGKMRYELLYTVEFLGSTS